MKVPYEEIGPGQKGRLVYQVMGDGGPIPNPKNIRYLPPDSVPQSTSVGPSGIGGALAATNTLLRAAEVGGELHNAIKLRQIESYLKKTLPRIERSLRAMNENLKKVLEKVDTIQQMEAEESLRDDLKHFLRRKHVRDLGTVDIRGLSEDLLESISRFEERADLRIEIGGARGLTFSVETQDLLSQAFQLLHKVRRTTYEAVNRRVDDPLKVLGFGTRGEDYWPDEACSFDAIALTLASLYSPPRDERSFLGMVNKKKIKKLGRLDPDARRLLPLFRKIDRIGDENGEGVIDRETFEAFKKWWIWESDAGLVHRVRREAEGIVEGYEHTFSLQDAGLPEHGSGTLFHLAAPNSDEEINDLISSLDSTAEQVI